MAGRQIGFVGLGNMGKPMALNLIRKGFRLTVFDIRKEPVEELQEAGAGVASSAAELGSASEVVICSLPAAPQLREVVLGAEGIAAGLKAGSLVMDMGTTDPLVTKEIAAALREKGCWMLDAPVSRGPTAALEGALTTMVGGPHAVFEEYREILEALASDVFYVGDTGTGQTVKIINNLLSFVNLFNITEAVALAATAGVDLPTLFEVVSVSSGNSWMFQYQASEIRSGDFDQVFGQSLVGKDLALATTLARRLGRSLTIAEAAEKVLEWGRSRHVSSREGSL